MQTQTVLILGGTGKIGRHATSAFAEAGWTVRQFDRSRDDLDAAMTGADVAVMGWNPPGYHLWADQMVPLHRKVAQAAARAGATVILPGNVYVYGPDAPRGWTADTPHLATNPLARLRIAAEACYREAGTRTIILRAGDFIDTEASGNWFDMFVASRAHRGVIRYPGALDAAHAWAFLPDLGRAMRMLAEKRAQLDRVTDVPFPGYTLTAFDLAKAIAAGRGHEVRAKRLSWAPLWLARPFMKMVPGLFEMRYLWSLPQHLDGAAFARLLPEFRATPVAEAMAAATAHLPATRASGAATGALV